MVITVYATDIGAAWSTRTLIWKSVAPSIYRSVYGMKLSLDVEKTGSLEFTVSSDHPYYSNFSKMKTILTVICDESDSSKKATLFRGRVSQIDTDIYKQKKITADDSLAFLNDSIYLPSGSDITSTPRQRLIAAITMHNSQMTGESAKCFEIGNISVSGADESKTYNDNSYSDISSYLKSELLDQYGGFFVVRYSDNYTTQYLDWVQSFNSNAPQRLRFGVNIIELSREDVSEDLFTVLVPTGDENTDISGYTSDTQTVQVTNQDGTKSNISVVPDGKFLKISPGIATYGYIYKSESFSEKTKAALFSEALTYISNNYHPTQHTFKIQAIDVHYIKEETTRIKLGDMVIVVYDEAGSQEKLMCSAIDYDLMEPENTEFTLGMSAQTLSKKKDKENTKARRSAGATAAAIAEGDNKKKKLEADIVDIIGHDYVNIEGGTISLNTDNFTLANTLGDAMLTTDETANLALDRALYVNELIANHLYADDLGSFTVDTEVLTVQNQADLARVSVANDLDVGNGYGGARFRYIDAGGTELTIDGYGLETAAGFPVTINGESTFNDAATFNDGLSVAYSTLSVIGSGGSMIMDPSNGLLQVTGSGHEVSIAGGNLVLSTGNSAKFRVTNAGVVSIYDPDSATVKDLLSHQHAITATEISGGHIRINLGEVTFTEADTIADFDIASTSFYQSAMADATRRQTVADIQFVSNTPTYYPATGLYLMEVSARSMYDTGSMDSGDVPLLAPMAGTNPDTFNFVFNPTDAFDAGGATAQLDDTTSVTLNYGESKTITAQYVNSNGQVINTSSSITITAPASGSSSVIVSSISYNSYSGPIPSTRTITATASNGNTKSVTVELMDGGWNRTNWTKIINLIDDSDVMVAQTTIDASFIVTETNAAVTVSGSWSGAVYTVTNSANARTAQTTLTLDTGTWPASAQPPFDRTIKVKADGVEIASLTTDINADTVYSVGWNRGGATAKLNDTTNVTLNYGESKTITAQYVNSNGQTVNTSSSITITAPASGSTDIIVSSITYNSYSGSVPSTRTITATASNGNTKSVTVELMDGGWNRTNWTKIINLIDDSDVVVARTTVDASSVYSAGEDSVTISSVSGTAGTGTSATITATASNNATGNVTLTLNEGTWDSSNWTKYVYIRQGTTNLARATIYGSSIYTAGANEVTLNAFTYDSQSYTSSNRTITANASNGATRDLSLYLVQGDWVSNTCYVYLRTGSASGTSRARVTIDASDIYSNGYTAGETAGANGVTLNAFTYDSNSWTNSSRILYANASNGAQRSLVFNLVQDNSWTSSNTKYVYLRTDSTTGNTRARIQIDASSVYTSGYNAGYAAGSGSSPTISIDRGTRSSTAPSPSNAVQIWSGSGGSATSVTVNYSFYSFKVTAGSSSKYYYFYVMV